MEQYKTFYTTYEIPWLNATNEDVPHYDFNDVRFNFKPMNDFGIKFIDWETAHITLFSEEITYIKVEHSGLRLKRYYYVNKILKRLSSGVVAELKLDIYMSYTKNFLKSIANENLNPIVERASLTRRMLQENDKLREIVFYAFKLDDELQQDNLYHYDNLRVIKNQHNLSFPLFCDIQVSGVARAAKIHYKQNNSDRQNFTLNEGRYAVFYTNEGTYDCYPIIENREDFSVEWIHNQTFTDSLGNDPHNIFRIIVGRLAAWLTERYPVGAFQGIYKGPVFGQSLTNKRLNYRGFQFSNDKETKTFICITFEPNNPIEIKFPFEYVTRLDTELVDWYVDLSQPIMWGKDEILPRKYFSTWDKDNPLKWSMNMYITFMREFFAMPKITNYTTQDDMIYFGMALPSASEDYVTQMRQIQASHDVGISNLVWGFAQGVPSAVGKAVASKGWGIASAVNSLFTLGRDITNLQLNKRNAKQMASMSSINSSTTTWYYANWMKQIFLKNDLLSTSASQNGRAIYDACVVKEFSPLQKEQIKYIINAFGFKLNHSLPLKDYVTLGQGKSLYIKFESTWIARNLVPNSALDEPYNKNIPMEVQERIIEQLSSGIRLHTEWR